MFQKIAIFFSVLCWSMTAMANTVVVPDYPVDKIAANVYIIHGPLSVPNASNKGFMNNPGIVLTTKGVVVIDPGATIETGEMVLRAIKKLTNKPVIAVFNTHQHADHWFGNAAINKAYPNAIIYAHEITVNDAPDIGKDWVVTLKDLTKLNHLQTKVVGAHKTVKHGDVISIGDTQFSIFHYGVTHTHSDIMVAVDNKAVFMGDNLFNGRLNAHSAGHIKKTWQAVEKVVADVQPKMIVPGHGQSGDLTMLKYALDVHKLLYQSVREQYENDIEDFEMRAEVEKKIADYKSWEGFDQQLGRVINKAYLEIEEADF